ncbi:hypothetical protein BCR37DRAFT_377594 [Protomyces lactucae-debilis]|uniref:SEC7 domain-containing protein n=1 Tax=Protomyces lactucae-debilis TaxID=2754530 RepID=A0A1Y2FMK1_PROLT|nr:uncharacterized protein BCR37DRAFT_377594 [Protomyces lactucae-debilis]ORY84817.1 hypothetical protein BCR37DRAFT_377594 [Protomyces lactucae-debilis]
MSFMTDSQPLPQHKPAFGWFKRKEGQSVAAAASDRQGASSPIPGSRVSETPPQIALHIPGESRPTTATSPRISSETPKQDECRSEATVRTGNNSLQRPSLDSKRPSFARTSPDAPHARRSSFFRLPRRKKASTANSAEAMHALPLRKSLDASTSFQRASGETSRLTFEGIRATFESIKRPNMSTRSSAASLRTAPSQKAPATALVAASATLAAQGSPRLELANPLDRLSLTRQHSMRSMTSFKSARSSPAPARLSRSGPALEQGIEPTSSSSSLHGKSRGRSLTYGGQASARKSSGTRVSKFFSMSKLRRDAEDPLFSLTLPIVGGGSGVSRGTSPLPPLSPAKTLEEKPQIPVMPLRLPEESPHAFLERLEGQMNHNVIASVLASSDDAFHLACLKQYMQKFDFSQDPLDMALRKFLMETKLPRETQQIDRVIDTFSERYQICNPRLFRSRETPHILTFALIMLHTDRFNQANKYKMTKQQFIKNTTSDQTDEVNSDILDYFYDNIVSTPFILVEDDMSPSPGPESAKTPTEFGALRGGSVTSLPASTTSFSRRSVDVYSLIMERNLSSLRPQLTDILSKPMTLSYTGTLPVINVAKLHSAFVNAARLQLVSERSRPEAYISEDGQQDPLATEPGLVDVKITKIGMLKKKEQKRANSKPVYREWGVMLTASQLLFFKDLGWVRHYMQQTLEHKKQELLTLTPPVHNYSPDTYMPTAHTVAFHDHDAKKKTHFSFLGRGGELAELTATSEEEMNDWIAKINYTAAFHTAGITIRGIETNAAAEAQSKAGRRARRHGSSSTLNSIAQPFPGSVDRLPEVVAARQNLIRQKIAEMDAQLIEREVQLQQFYRHARSLATLTPILPRTRQHLISAAASCSAKISWQRQETLRTQCHRDILVKDLELELDPKAQAFTVPMRTGSPNGSVQGSTTSGGAPGSRASLSLSPSKVKLSSVGHTIRRASTDTLKRVNRQFASHDARGGTSTRLRNDLAEADADAVLMDGSDVLDPTSPFRFGNGHRGQPVHSAGSADGMDKSTSQGQPSNRPQTAPTLSLEIPHRSPFPVIKRRASKDSKASGAAENAEGSNLASQTSLRSGPFLLHGRKVSVVQTPVALVSPVSPTLDSHGDGVRIWPDVGHRPSSPGEGRAAHGQVVSLAHFLARPTSPGALSIESFQDAMQEFEEGG